MLNATNYPDNWSTYRYEVTKTNYDRSISTVIDGLFTGGQENLRNRVATSSYQEVYNTDKRVYDHASHYSYDIHGNVKTLIQDNPELSVYNQEYKRMDYEYDLISGKVNEVKYQAGETDAFYHKYSYDADNRITAVLTSSDGKLWDGDASYNYYDHGPLARTELGDLKVQGLDYAYTLQGWIKGVNSTTLQSDRDMGADGNTSGAHASVGRDAYGYGLTYYAGDYASIGSSTFLAMVDGTSLGNATHGLFNGNISKMVTAISPVSGQAAIPIQGRAFAYDQLNRLTDAYAYTGSNIVSNNSFTGTTNNGDYQEHFSYDANGNIEALSRKGHSTGGQNPDMDALTYRYDTDVNGHQLSNKLLHVNDNVSYTANYNDDIDDQGAYNQKNETTHNYGYDEIGNLVKDNQEKITRIDWNVYGKIKNIHKVDGSNTTDITFKYDAQGNRISKGVVNTFVPPMPFNHPSRTYYIRDASGNVMAVYELKFPTDAPTLSLTEHHLYGSQRLGVVAAYGYTEDHSDDKYSRHLGIKRYELSNHLGNVLNVVSDKKLPHNNGGSIDYYLADVVSATDYYSFGSPMAGRNVNNANYRYGFNGKEKDDEVSGNGNQYDYGDRNYNSRLGRWNSPDGKAAKYPQWSPYHFGYCNPVTTIDPNGDENVVVVGAENHSETTGNKLMFMVQAIRQIRKYKDMSGEATNVLLFSHGYTEKQIKTFERVAKFYGVNNVVKISNVDEVVNYINSKDAKTVSLSQERENDPISNMDAFSHGLPGRITFDFDGGVDNTNLTIEKVNQIDPKAFGKDPSTGAAPIFSSYACRTGTPDDDGNNLAQAFANRTGATVKAFQRRSNYEDTFSTELIRSYSKAVKIDNYLPGYGTALFIFTHGVNTYHNVKQLDKALNDATKRYKVDGGLFDERGAIKDVKSGETPDNLPAGQFEFKPQSENKK